VILFLNGAFGIGKTTTARLLIERIPDAMLYDPEIVGAFLRKLLEGVAEQADFQDHSLWEPMVVETARMLKTEYGFTLVIPMTVWRRERFERLAEGLRAVDPDLRLFRLTATEKTLRERILSRAEAEGDHGWCLRHLEVCLEASEDPAFGTEIRTDGRSPEEVTGEVLATMEIQKLSS
jgi:predicted kinase